MKTIFTSFVCCLIAVASFSQPGTVDSSFGINGFASVNLSTKSNSVQAQFSKIVISKDKMLFATGLSLLAKFFPDGKIDSSFGINGVVQTQFNHELFFNNLAIEPNGKIILCGYVSYDPSLNNYTNSKDVFVVRYFPNGNLDSSFGTNGIILKNYGYEDDGVSVLPLANGGFYIAGNLSLDNEINGRFLILKFKENGIEDSSFGDNGKVVSKISLHGERCTAAILQGNKIVLTGDYYTDFGNLYSDFLLARYMPNGKIDFSFGKNGFSKYFLNGHFNLKSFDCAVQKDGKIILAGASDLDYGISSDYCLGRFTKDGILDSSFANDGISIILPKGLYYFNYFKSIVLDNNENILGVGGESDEIVKCNNNGSLDSSFAVNGVDMIKGLNEFESGFNGIVVKENNEILACGYNYLTNYIDASAIIVECKNDTQKKTPISFLKGWIAHYILHWQNMQPSANVNAYSIEQSNNGINGFTEIAKVFAGNKNAYSYALPASANSSSSTTNYYRINAISSTGNIIASTSVISDVIAASTAISIYPNPVNNVLHIKGLDAATSYTVSISNAKGNVLLSSTIKNAADYNLNVQALYKGVYYANITSANKQTTALKFLKD